jgi:hypothetical protein
MSPATKVPPINLWNITLALKIIVSCKLAELIRRK